MLVAKSCFDGFGQYTHQTIELQNWVRMHQVQMGVALMHAKCINFISQANKHAF